MNINNLRKRLSSIGRKKSVGPDGISGEILKIVGETMIPFLAKLLDITMNNNARPGYWIKAIVVPIYKGMICKQMEHVISGYSVKSVK